MKYHYLIFFFLFPFLALAQNEECGTLYAADPYFDAGEYERFKEKYLRKQLYRDDELIEIPLRINIVRHNDGTGGFDESKIEKTVEDMNVQYEAANIKFSICGDYSFVDKNEFYDFDRNLFQDQLITFNHPDVVNVYFINKIFSSSSQICGYASFPWFDDAYVVVQNNCATNGSTFAHELGHFLGLLHTHETARGEELVDRTNCTFTGDELCDTPADPRLGNSTVNAACEYTGSSKDLNNKTYAPDPTNVMSYSRKSCRNKFSEEQKMRMRYYFERDRSGLACPQMTSTKSPDVNTLLALYPIPANQSVSINWKNKDWRPDQIKITNLLGQELRQIDVNAISFDVSQMEKGIYFLVFKKEGIQFAKRLIISK